MQLDDEPDAGIPKGETDPKKKSPNLRPGPIGRRLKARDMGGNFGKTAHMLHNDHVAHVAHEQRNKKQ